MNCAQFLMFVFVSVVIDQHSTFYVSFSLYFLGTFFLCLFFVSVVIDQHTSRHPVYQQPYYRQPLTTTTASAPANRLNSTVSAGYVGTSSPSQLVKRAERLRNSSYCVKLIIPIAMKLFIHYIRLGEFLVVRNKGFHT